MPNTMQERIAKSHAQAVQGQISFAKAAREQMARAQELFPHAASPGAAMAEYLKTDVGKRDVGNLASLEFLKQQWDNRIGDGARAVLKLGEGDGHGGGPHIHYDNSKDGAVDSDSPDDQGVEEPWDKRVKNLMDKHGMSYDQAVSHLHRAEKVAKGF